MAGGSTGAASAKRDAGTKLAQQRLSVLELAKELVNAVEAYLATRLGLTNVIDLYPEPIALAKRDPDGTLHARDPDACCEIRKVHPLARALKPYEAWITGRRRHQTFSRRALPVVEADGPHIKLNPIVTWSQEDVDNYIDERGLPRHPLVAQGYPSIGCEPCTNRPAAGEDARAGRWDGSGKTECGIHWMR